MKKLLITMAVITAVFMSASSVSANENFSYNYEFSSGADYSTALGKATETSIVPKNTQNINYQNNKDTSHNPPAYGVFSGNIDTARSNPYFSPQNYSVVRNATDETIPPITNQVNNNGTGGFETNSGVLPSTSTMNNQGNVTVTHTQNQTTTQTDLKTEPLYYTDNSIGTLSIPRFNVNVKVYEGENLDNLKKGLGHFAFSSTWDGNVALCGHNDKDFKHLQSLNVGDEIIYTTKYGTRTYEMSSRTTISDTDYSTLDYSSSNCLTLITCVNGEATQRYSVLAVEK